MYPTRATFIQTELLKVVVIHKRMRVHESQGEKIHTKSKDTTAHIHVYFVQNYRTRTQPELTEISGAQQKNHSFQQRRSRREEL